MIRFRRQIPVDINFIWCNRKLSNQSYRSSYQFLHRSKLPTYYFQKSLPRLPIPKLELTSSRFLAAVQPILDQKEYDSTVHILSNFLTGDGVKLQELLIKYDNVNTHTSYISEPW